MQGMPIVQASSAAWAAVGSMWSSGFNSGWILDQSIGSTGAFTQSVSPASSGQGFYSTGDGTAYYLPGRMLKVIDAGGTHYCEVLSSSSSAVAGTTSSTIVTITNVVSGTTTLSTGSLTSVSGSPIFSSSGMLSNFGPFSTGSASLPGIRFRGPLGGIGLSVDASTFLGFNVLGTAIFSMSTAALLGVSDNSYDIGASGATRPRTGYFGTAVVIGTTPATAGTIRLPNVGTIKTRNATNDADIQIATVDVSNRVILSDSASATQILSSVRFPNIGTTASAANAFVDGADNNNLLRSTSSLRYKNVIGNLSLSDAQNVILKAEAIVYTSKSKADDPNTVYVGFASEQIAEVDKRFVTLDNEGRPDWVHYQALAAPLIVIAKDHENRLQELDQRLMSLERVA